MICMSCSGTILFPIHHTGKMQEKYLKSSHEISFQIFTYSMFMISHIV